MANKRKGSWLLKDPNFVPKSKRIRIAMFIIVNSILISLLPILAISINYPYGYLCWILVLSFAVLFNMKAFHVHVERYPLNKYSEYKFNPLLDVLNGKDKDFFIEVERKSNIYEVKLKEKTLIFDMKGCILPLTIIIAYLGRQFIIEYINKYKLITDTMGKNINVSSLFNDYMNIQIIYKNKRKIKKYFLIKDSKTKMNNLMKSINGYGYLTWYVRYHKMDKYFVKITEQEFIERKMYYNKNML